MFAFVGVAALCFAVERTRGWRNIVVVLCLAMSAVAVYEHVRLFRHLAATAEPGEHRVLTNYLLAHGVRYARAPYWAAYQVAFLSGEKIVATPSDLVARVLEYDRLVSAHAGEAADVSTEPCDGGEQVARWYVCLPAVSTPILRLSACRRDPALVETRSPQAVRGLGRSAWALVRPRMREARGTTLVHGD